MENRRGFLAGLGGILLPSLVSAADERVFVFREDFKLLSSDPRDPDFFRLGRLGIPLPESRYLYQQKQIGVLGKFLNVASHIDNIDRRYVRIAKDGTHSFYCDRRYFSYERAKEWRKHLVEYRDHPNLLPNYSVDAALLFATWLAAGELAPVVTVTASAVGLWEFGVNLFNDYRRIKDAGHMIDTVDTTSFIFTQLELNPKKPTHCKLAVLYQADANDRAIPIWAQSYSNLLDEGTMSAIYVEGWSQ